MSYELLSESVKLSEGFRNKIYQDTEGFDTIGWGHKVVPADNFVADKEYTEEELQAVFDKDLSRAIAQAKQLMSQNDIDNLPETAQHVLSEMCFQLGVNGVSKFKNALAHAKNHAWDKCADELLSSRWHQQTPNRAKALADVMRGK